MKHLKRIKMIALVLISILGCTTLCGCIPKEDLENTTVVTGIFLDFSFPDQSYTLVAETIDFSGYEKSKMPKTELIKASGKTIAKTFSALSFSVEKEIYYSHAKVLLLGSGYQSLPVKHTVEYLMNHRNINSDIMLCFADFDSKKLEESKETFSMQTITQFLKKENAPKKTKLYQLYRMENVFFLPEISLENERVSLNQTAVFYKNIYETDFIGDDNLIFRLLHSEISKEPLILKEFDILIIKGTTKANIKNNRFTADISVLVQLTDAKYDEIISPEMSLQLKQTIETELREKSDSFLMRLSQENKAHILPGNPTDLSNAELRFHITISQIGTLNQF